MINAVTPLFSIITPCYNAEKFLNICVESILRQNFKEWELILIDDGSKDSTPIICDKYADRDSRIKVIHQNNSGVSAARNRGLDVAKGKWVLFIDSDDWFTDEAFNIYIDSINKYESDRFVFNRFSFKNGKSVQSDLKPDILKRENEQISLFLIDMLFPYYDLLNNGVVTGGIRGVNCSLYRRKIIEEYNIRFEESVKIAEDAMFNFDFAMHSKCITMQNLMVGYYRIEESSVMHRFNPMINEINTNTIVNFKKRIEPLTKTDERFKIAYLGMVSECLFRGMKLYFVNPSNNRSLRERIKEFKEWFYQDLIQDGIDYSYLKYLPKGKRQMMWCTKEKCIRLMMLIAKLSIYYLKKKDKI